MIKLVISSTCSQFIINIPFIYVIYNSFKFFYKASMNLTIHYPIPKKKKKQRNKEKKCIDSQYNSHFDNYETFHKSAQYPSF